MLWEDKMGNTVDINIKAVKNAVGDIEEVYRQLMKYDGKLLDIKNNLRESQYGQIKQAISVIENENKQNYIRVNKLAKTLLEIINTYESAENNVKTKEIQAIKITKVAGDSQNLESESSYTTDDDSKNFKYVDENGKEIVFHVGEPTQPQWSYDNDFPYDPNATPTLQDYYNWAKWKVLNEGAEHFGGILNRDMPDAIDAYEHYRSGKGTDLKIDYQKAYEEDANIKKTIDGYINDTQHLVEQMIESGQQCPFSITSEIMPVGDEYYPSTENWQKTIGAHQVWISADVTVDENGNINMDTTVHELDRYNFNKGMADIASGASDNENGRFEELGWAKSFTTTGEANFDVTWTEGNINDTTEQSISGSDDRGGTVSYTHLTLPTIA